jgi:tetratricopeptide (TPR) repeat protein
MHQGPATGLLVETLEHRMKAFLSHSSKDKGFVEAVADLLRPGTFELDSLTFDAGAVNAQTILEALNRSDLFCLFLSTSSVRSAYVEFETLLGMEFLARGGIKKFLAICLDEEAFDLASANIKFFSIVRRGLLPEATARLIQGFLVSASTSSAARAHPFLGRTEEIAELEQQVSDHARPLTKGFFISGIYGSGRKTLVQKFYEQQYPEVGRIFPTITIDPLAGLEEFHRQVLTALRPTMTVSDLKTRVQSFAIAPNSEKRRQITQLINSLLPAREAAFLVDTGGLQTEAGALEPEVDQVISNLEARPHPPIAIIARRMIPLRLRRPQNDLAYLSVGSLKRDSSENLISRLLKDKGITATREQISELVNLGDGHPFNFYRMADEITERGMEPFLANPREFIEWKHRQSSEYLRRIELSSEDILILGLLRLAPELDFTAIITALPIDPATASDRLLRLTNVHAIEASEGSFLISPPLRIAIEKDSRISLAEQVQATAIRALVLTLSIRLEEGTAPITLIDSAVLLALQEGGLLADYVAAFLLPSHYVWLAKRKYDAEAYRQSIHLCQEALDRADRLSPTGVVAACRYLCLAAARLGEDSTFELGIRRLESFAQDDWAKSNVLYLRGFNYRMKGNLPKAEEAFRASHRILPGNRSATREIAAICLARNNLDEAETYAREALSQAGSNPYFLDMLIAVLIRRYGNSVQHLPKINELFDRLEQVSEEEGRSFFTTRKAEFEHRWGDNGRALTLIEAAVAKTPRIFEPRRLYVEILLKAGNKAKAQGVLTELERQVKSRSPNERRTNYRAYLETYSHYLTEIGRYPEAKELYEDPSIFTVEERNAAIREIEIVQSFRTR